MSTALLRRSCLSQSVVSAALKGVHASTKLYSPIQKDMNASTALLRRSCLSQKVSTALLRRSCLSLKDMYSFVEAFMSFSVGEYSFVEAFMSFTERHERQQSFVTHIQKDMNASTKLYSPTESERLNKALTLLRRSCLSLTTKLC